LRIELYLKAKNFKMFALLVFANTVSSLLWGSKTADKTTSFDPNNYGVDVTSPIHHGIDKSTIFGQRYVKLMNGCYTWSDSKIECDASEDDRMQMNREQPAAQINYTDIGFKKIKAPKALWDPLIAFYERNKNGDKIEEWTKGNAFVNFWEAPTHMISFEDASFPEGLQVKE